MGLKLDWDNQERTVIRCEFTGEWTWREFKGVMRTCFAMITVVDHNVDVILDLRKSQYVPRRTTPYAHQSEIDAPSNCGLIAFVSQDCDAHMALALFRRAHKQLDKRFLSIDSLEEARNLLTQLSPTKPQNVVSFPASNSA